MKESWKLPLSAPPQLLMIAISVHHPQPDYDCYRLPGLWCLHFYRYRGELKIDGASFPIYPGSCSITPPGAALEYSYHQTPSIHTVAHFRLEEATDAVLALPPMRNLGAQFKDLADAFEAAIPWRSTQPARAQARVWDILWRLGAWEQERSGASTPLAAHAAIERARHDIEMRLSTPLRVEEVAARAGFSHNHFTRLFCASVGSTPSQYIRARRVERAAHLLKNSTLPVKAIASQCGLGDLQAFNKTIRSELKMSPREVRK